MEFMRLMGFIWDYIVRVEGDDIYLGFMGFISDLFGIYGMYEIYRFYGFFLGFMGFIQKVYGIFFSDLPLAHRHLTRTFQLLYKFL